MTVRSMLMRVSIWQGGIRVLASDYRSDCSYHLFFLLIILYD